MLLVLPTEEISKDKYERALKSVSLLSLKTGSLHTAADQSYAKYYRELLGKDVLIYSQTDLDSYDIIIFMEGRGGKSVLPAKGKNTQRIYRMDDYSKIDLCYPALDKNEYPHLNKHIFNRLSAGLNSGFYYFPYGYLYRLTGLGPINEFGHRISIDLSSLESRGKEHKVIAIYGGSAAWSIFSQHEEMFAHRLEQKLNNYCKEASLPYFFSVLNFALPGNVVLNEMLTFLMFCNKIRPDIVIAHDGFNDMVYGQASDPYLLNKYDITYQLDIEPWSQILHNSEEIKIAWSSDTIPIVNFPRAIINAYCDRLMQFQGVVHGIGAAFIAALQPMIYSKKALSSSEKELTEYHLEQGRYSQVFKKMSFLYEKYLEKQPSLCLQHFLNMHNLFYRFGQNDTMLLDVMHTSPQGDEAIAGFYSDYIKEHILPSIASSQR